MATTDPCSESLFSQILGGNALVCSKTFQSYETSQEQTQIQGVVDNANTYYGEGSTAAKAATTFAAGQLEQATGDTADVTAAVGLSTAGRVFGGDCNGNPGVDLSIVGGPCLSYTLLKEIGLGLLLALIVGVVLYGVAILGPFIPKGQR